MSTNELISKVRELKELKIMADELQAEITTIEDAIKAEMTARQVNEMTVDVFRVRWAPVTSRRLDTTALKNALPEVAEKFTKETVSRRFTIA